MTTAAHFANWTAKAANMTIEGLQYSIRDCRQAAEAARGWDSAGEGKYMDEMSVYLTEIRQRSAVANPEQFNIAA